MVLLIASGIVVFVIVALALAMPCEGCRLRRERMRQAYERWRSSR